MKICFIGTCGHSMQAYIEMSKCADAEFVGVAFGSADEGNPESLNSYGIKTFPSYEEMIEETSPDVAVVSPIFGLTGKIIKYCAERKIDVFAEKPVASSLEELEEIEKAVKDNGIHFSAMHYLRFSSAFYHAQKEVENGAIGEVKLLTAQKSYKYGVRPDWYSDRALYTGTIPWIGIHAIDWVYFFAKKQFKSVSALHCGNPEKTALCQFEMEDDVFASVNLDYYRPSQAPSHGDDRIRVVGTKGIIEVRGRKYQLINEDGVKEIKPEGAPNLAYEFLMNREELSADEVFMLTRVALIAREAADIGKKLEI